VLELRRCVALVKATLLIAPTSGQCRAPGAAL